MDSSTEKIWMTPRSCGDYWNEFKHCKTLWNRFNHYYTVGTFLSCRQWKEDYRNCIAWEEHKSAEAKEALVKSERCRLEEQRRFTPVWKLRQEPPREWNLPLNQESPVPPRAQWTQES